MWQAGPKAVSPKDLSDPMDLFPGCCLYGQFYFGLAHPDLPEAPRMADIKNISPFLSGPLGETGQIARSVRNHNGKPGEYHTLLLT